MAWNKHMWFTVYDLRKCPDKIKGMQEASHSHKTIPYTENDVTRPMELGISLKHGLVGSDQWWNDIGSGKIQTRVTTGKISRLSGGYRGDLHEVEIETEDGSHQVFLRYGNPDLYRLQDPIRLTHALLEWKSGEPMELCLMVELDHDIDAGE